MSKGNIENENDIDDGGQLLNTVISGISIKSTIAFNIFPHVFNPLRSNPSRK